MSNHNCFLFFFSENVCKYAVFISSCYTRKIIFVYNLHNSENFRTFVAKYVFTYATLQSYISRLG